MRNPYEIVKSRYVTEKATVLENLRTAESNPSVARFKNPKYVFLVERTANKAEIATAIEEIYKAKNVKVVKVNTIQVKSKPKRRGRARPGGTAAFKKAIVTLEVDDVLDRA